SRSTPLRQCGANDNQIDQDELFNCHVNSAATRLTRKRQQALGVERGLRSWSWVSGGGRIDVATLWGY
ncbi:hypothetical protein, partial [Halomonas cupida]|uniref:hypothetical protein n=1 Tax=Halomonas cupida TaxID=44933 RepID=UPI003A8CC3F7